MAITNFPIEKLVMNGAALVGDKKEQNKTIDYIIDNWKNSFGALLILDHNGEAYRKHGSKGFLVDMESVESVFPDFYRPIIQHRKFGKSPMACAKLICDTIIKPSKHSSSNDAFFEGSGRRTLIEFIAYQLILASVSPKKKFTNYNITAIATEYADYLKYVMEELVEKSYFGAARWLEEDKRQKRSKDPEIEPLSDKDEMFKELLHRYFDKQEIPFKTTLASYSRQGGISTYLCVLRETYNSGARLFEFNTMLSEDAEYFAEMQPFSFTDFVKDERNILFVSGTQNKDMSTLIALLSALSTAVSADEKNVKATCLITDISEWDVFDGIHLLSTRFPRTFNVIVGCTDFAKAARQTYLTKEVYFDTLADITEQNIIWHKSNHSFLKSTYEDRTSGIDVMYSPKDLGGNGLVAIDESGEISYAYVPETEITTLDCHRTPRRYAEQDIDNNWFFNGENNDVLTLLKPETLKEISTPVAALNEPCVFKPEDNLKSYERDNLLEPEYNQFLGSLSERAEETYIRSKNSSVDSLDNEHVEFTPATLSSESYDLNNELIVSHEYKDGNEIYTVLDGNGLPVTFVNDKEGAIDFASRDSKDNDEEYDEENSYKETTIFEKEIEERLAEILVQEYEEKNEGTDWTEIKKTKASGNPDAQCSHTEADNGDISLEEQKGTQTPSKKEESKKTEQ